MDRFDLEMAINRCRAVTDDIEDLYEAVLDSPKYDLRPQDADRLANVLLGISELYKMRFEKLEDCFCQVFKIDKYFEPPVEQATIDFEQQLWEGRVSDHNPYQTELSFGDSWDQFDGPGSFGDDVASGTITLTVSDDVDFSVEPEDNKDK